MNQTKDQINSKALLLVQGLKDKERLIYEIGADTDVVTAMTYWPNNKTKCDIWATRAFYYNSQGKQIAIFRVKSTKQTVAG